MDASEMKSIKRMSSLPYWWERTRALDGVPQPKTEYVHYGSKKLAGALDGGPLDMEPLLVAAEAVGGYPIFLRTDQMSGKHSWKDTCYVESADVMLGHVMSLLEENYMSDMVGEATPSGLAVREFLELDWKFKAFHGQAPISTEVRTFLRDGAIECVHPYWAPKSIADWAEPPQVDLSEYGISVSGMPEGLLSSPGKTERDFPNDWRDILAEQDSRVDADIDVIRAQALRVAAVMDGWWSCDMALGRDGVWYMIDMAPGAASYHWPSCEHAPER